MLAAFAIAGGAFFQKVVYNVSVCGKCASTCVTQSFVFFWDTCVIYGLTGIFETFDVAFDYQIALFTSLSNMKSLVISIFFLFMNVFFLIIGAAFLCF